MGKKSETSVPPKKKIKSENEVESKEYWAEAILDWGLHNDGTMMYLVKWWDYPDSDNSWEFQQHVSQCSDLLLEFHMTKVNGIQPPKWSFDEFDKMLKFIEELIETKDLALFRKLSKRRINCFEIRDKEVVKEIRSDLKKQLSLMSNKFEKLKPRTNSNRLEAIELIKRVISDLNIVENFGSISNFLDFVERRRVVTKELSNWEQHINQIIKSGGEGQAIRVVNDIDLEKPKFDGYITEYILDINFEDRIKLEKEKPLTGCQCRDCSDSRDECCTAVVGFPFVYTNKGLLSSKPFHTIIYECNSKCECPQSCPNRTVQRGRQFKLEIFRTDSESRGWGVRSQQDIPKGSFITEYTGEVISEIEAAKRPSTYLFDLSAHLDSSEAEFTYVVDASRFGNIARFVNHSCAPNCRILFAWTERSTNKLLPIIALFAIKDIEANEELTYDYSMELMDFYKERQSLRYHQMIDESRNSLDSEEVPQNGSKTSGLVTQKPRRAGFRRVECECGADSCRNFLYT